VRALRGRRPRDRRLARAQNIAHFVERLVDREGVDPASVLVLCVERGSPFWADNLRTVAASFGDEAVRGAERLGYALTSTDRDSFARALRSAGPGNAANDAVLRTFAEAPAGSIPVVHCTESATVATCLRLVRARGG
jgi:hypothetical protein